MSKTDLSKRFNSAPEKMFKISELYSENAPDNRQFGDPLSFTVNQFISSGAKLNSSPVIQRIVADLMLTFVAEIGKQSNVCFVNDEEVRPEYRLTFSPLDMLDYILGIRRTIADSGEIKQPKDENQVPYPKDAVDFWKAVDLGRSIRLGAMRE